MFSVSGELFIMILIRLIGRTDSFLAALLFFLGSILKL